MTDGPEKAGSASAPELALLHIRVLLNEGTDQDGARLPLERAMRRHVALLHPNLQAAMLGIGAEQPSDARGDRVHV
jgi:hypothetical protein